MHAGFSEAITVRALTKAYPTRDGSVVALERISFAVPESEFVAVVGPSGCGKSTLLKILSGILPPSAGEALLRGTPIAGPRRDIGVVFQSPVLFPWRTVLEDRGGGQGLQIRQIAGLRFGAARAARPDRRPSRPPRRR